MAYLWVAIGGALGSMARYGFSGVVASMSGGTFPYGTMLVNVTGAMIDRLFRKPQWSRQPLLRPGLRPSLLNDRHLRRLHHFLNLQPRNHQPDARWTMGRRPRQHRLLGHTMFNGGMDRARWRARSRSPQRSMTRDEITQRRGVAENLHR